MKEKDIRGARDAGQDIGAVEHFGAHSQGKAVRSAVGAADEADGLALAIDLGQAFGSEPADAAGGPFEALIAESYSNSHARKRC
jgi:hypothetical protein